MMRQPRAQCGPRISESVRPKAVAIRPGPRPADAPGVSIFVQVLDLDDTLRRAEAMGGRAVMQPFDVPGGPTVAQMADPEGNLVGLVKQ